MEYNKSMKLILSLLLILLGFSGCTEEKKVSLYSYLQSDLMQSDFSKLPNWRVENYQEVLGGFIQTCQKNGTQNIYKTLCQKALHVKDPKAFIENNFNPYKIVKKKKSLLTGYYEPLLYGSLNHSERYRYAIYKRPDDLIEVDLDSIYPELKKYRLRGRLKDGKIIPYLTREEIKKSGLDADVLCYTDSKIDKFFLEVQGSGRIALDNNKTIFFPLIFNFFYIKHVLYHVKVIYCKQMVILFV